MAGDFSERLDELSKLVGEGTLEGSVIVDQLYAKYIHEDLTLNHPRGGQAKYLEEPLLAKSDEYMQRLADRALDEDGLRSAMKDNVEDLSNEVEKKAPIQYGPLHYSGHPTVTDDGELVYDRAPIYPRLTEAELEALQDMHDGDRSRHSPRGPRA
jgi:hypothetical protein